MPHDVRQLLDSLSSIPVEETEALKMSAVANTSSGMSFAAMLLIGILACCCWGLLNCLLHIMVMRRPMQDFGGRVTRISTVSEWREALASADAAGQLLLVLTCAGWHQGCRTAARIMAQVSVEYEPESCLFCICDLSAGASVARMLHVVVIPTFKLFRNQVEVESHASYLRLRSLLEFHGARRLDALAETIDSRVDSVELQNEWATLVPLQEESNPDRGQGLEPTSEVSIAWAARPNEESVHLVVAIGSSSERI